MNSLEALRNLYQIAESSAVEDAEIVECNVLFEAIKKDLEMFEKVKQSPIFIETDDETLIITARYAPEFDDIRYSIYYYKWQSNNENEPNNKKMNLVFSSSSAAKPITIEDARELVELTGSKE